MANSADDELIEYRKRSSPPGSLLVKFVICQVRYPSGSLSAGFAIRRVRYLPGSLFAILSRKENCGKRLVVNKGSIQILMQPSALFRSG